MAKPILKRLTKRTQFLFVRRGARAARSGVLVEARRRDEGGHWIGVGFTASAKVGGAVVRNRARRRLREAVREVLPELGLGGVDYVFVARQQTPSTPWPSLLDDVRNALIRLRADLSPEAPAKQRSAKARSASEGE